MGRGATRKKTFGMGSECGERPRSDEQVGHNEKNRVSMAPDYKRCRVTAGIARQPSTEILPRELVVFLIDLGGVDLGAGGRRQAELGCKALHIATRRVHMPRQRVRHEVAGLSSVSTYGTDLRL